MKFIISRVSGETPPCKGAVSELVTHTHQQKCHRSDGLSRSLEFIEKHNHTYRVKNGFHKWDVTFEVWTIEIHTLEELVTLQEKVGELILGGSIGEHPTLKIYDDYIE